MSKFWPLIKLLPIRTNFQFVKYARLFGSLSILLVIGSIFFTVYPADNKCGGLTCGVDFLGGNLVELSTRPEPVDLAEIRASLNGMGVPDVQVQSYSVPGSDPTGRFHAMAKFGNIEGATSTETIHQVKAALTRDLGPDVRFTRTEAVGAAVSGGREFLVGDRLSAADVTFAALAAPALFPDRITRWLCPRDQLPAPMRAEVDRFRATPAGAYALRLYSHHR